MIGLTSVSFRSLSPERILVLAKAAGLNGIEWGGDIHLPPGDTALAERIGKLTRAAGLVVFSYGSYYKLLRGDNFEPVLKTAAALGAPLIRVWAGEIPSAKADGPYYERAAVELGRLCREASAKSIEVALEYHRGTLTDTGEGAQKILRLAGVENLSTYWQPNPDLPPDEHYREIAMLLPFLSQVHVFYWERGNIRRPLAEGAAVWKTYIELLGKNRNYIMEFVKDDSEQNFLADAAVLKDLVRTG
jgi:sugar phosphate isomerase/epimerase